MTYREQPPHIQRTLREKPQQEREIPREWSYEQFRQFLMDACKKDSETGIVSFEDLPDTIDLGFFHRKTQECVQQTIAEKEKHEHGSDIFYDPERGKILIKAKTDKGTTNSVSMTVNPAFYYTSKAVRDSNKRTIGLVHSHPDNITFSHNDIANFLASPDTKIMTVGLPNGVTEILVATHETKWMLSEEAARRNDFTEYEEQLDKWTQLLGRIYRKYYPERTTFSSSESEAINNQVFSKFAQHTSVNYRFGYYRSDESGIARRVLPPKKKSQ